MSFANTCSRFWLLCSPGWLVLNVLQLVAPSHICFCKTTWILCTFWLVKKLLVTVPVDSQKITATYTCFKKTIVRIFKGLTDVVNPFGMFGEHSPLACVVKAFLVFPQHTAWVYYAGKPWDHAVYCLKITDNRSIIHFSPGARFEEIMFWYSS